MNNWIPDGCELTKRGRSDLREAIRCVLMAATVLVGVHSGSLMAQQSVVPNSALPPSTLETVQVFGFMVQPETVVSAPMSLGFGNATLYIDGVRQDDFYMGPVETHNYQPPSPVVYGENSQPRCEKLTKNPVDVSNGMKHVHAEDFRSVSNPDLKLSRYKNPLWFGIGIFGQYWISNLDVKIATDSCDQAPGKPSCEISASSGLINLYTEQGGIQQFQKAYAVWNSSNGGTGHLSRIDDGSSDTGKYILNVRGGYNSPQIKFRRNGQIESITNKDGNNLVYTYDAGNRLTKVTHSSGRSIVLSWNGGTQNVVTSITAPNGATYSFEYAQGGRAPFLVKVNYPDGKGNIEYVGDPLQQIKINGQVLKNYTYQSIFGTGSTLVASSSFADGTDLVRYSYFQDDAPDYLHITRTETVDGYGKKTRYLLQDGMLVETVGDASVHCSAAVSKATYSGAGLLETATSNSGVTTRYEYDAYRRKVRQIEGLGTSQQRTTTWQWDNDPNDLLRTELIKKITVEGYSSTTYGYHPLTGLLASITDTNLTSHGAINESRAIALDYTFHPNGLVASIAQDGPLPGTGDYKKMFYNSMGDLVSVENSLGQVRTFSGHNGFGQPGRIMDGAGAVTEYEYDARGRVVVERRFPNGSAVETRYVYGASGLLDAVTSSDGNVVYRHYDSAQRLIQEDQVEPGGGYAVKRYTYDAMSKPIKVEVGRDN